MKGWEEVGRANTLTGALPTFSEKFGGEADAGEQELFLGSHFESAWLREKLSGPAGLCSSTLVAWPVG